MRETLLQLPAWGTRRAIVNQKGQDISFGEFASRAGVLAGHLRREGIVPGSKWVVLAELDSPLYLGIATLFQLGAIVVLVDPWAPADYLEKALGQVSPDGVLIGGKAKLFLGRKAFRNIPRRLSLDKLLKLPGEPLLEAAERSDDDTALITFTSGSSGRPKGFDRTHGFLRAQQAAHEKFFSHAPGDVDLCMYPVFVLSNLKQGMTSVLINAPLRDVGKADMEKILRQVHQAGATSCTLSPRLLRMLVDHAKKRRLKLPFHHVYTGGAPISPVLLSDFESVCAGKWTVVYGSTEAEPIALLHQGDVPLSTLEAEPGFPLGEVVPDLRLELVPVTGLHPAHPLPLGEVLLTGDFVGKRYWQNEEAFRENKRVDPDGTIWHRTGDVVYQKDGKLFMVGRRHNGLATAQGLLFPLPVEKELERLPGVEKAALLTFRGETVVVLQGKGYDAQAIQGALKGLSARLVPVSAIPLDSRHRAKIDHHALTRLLESEMSMDANAPLAARLLAYTKERFPLGPIALFVFLLTFSPAALFGFLTGTSFDWDSGTLWAAFASTFLLMLQLRMMDEIKDAEKDRIAYPERLLSRGVVTQAHVKAVLVTVVALQLAINLVLGGKLLLLWAVTSAWSFLMFKEFFLGEWLEKRLGLYFLTHQVILFPIVAYSGAALCGVDAVLGLNSLPLALLALSLPSSVYEISRKTWSPDRESVHADSYTRVWGRTRTVALTAVLMSAQIYVQGRLGGAREVHLGLLAVAALVYLMLAALFLKNPVRKTSKNLEHAGSLFLLLAHILNLVFFA